MFTFNFTHDKLKLCIPQNANLDDWYNIMLNKLPNAPNNINTILRVAAFLAQCSVESAQFNRFDENLDYTADRLMQVFPKYFPDFGTATAYEHRPEQIADKVYASRMGNGNEQSGDGWRYHGRGIIQITGKSNYTSFANDTYGSSANVVLDNPEFITQNRNNALETALWYWRKKTLNILADKQDIKTMTYLINGGYNGLDQREKNFLDFKTILGKD